MQKLLVFCGRQLAKVVRPGQTYPARVACLFLISLSERMDLTIELNLKFISWESFDQPNLSLKRKAANAGAATDVKHLAGNKAALLICKKTYCSRNISRFT